jgi:hypothetical protein
LRSFEDALKALKSSPNNHDGAALQRVYNKYKFTYDAQSRELARSVKDYSIEGIKERIHTIASALRQQAVPIIQGRVPKCKLQISKHPEEFGELLGLVSASWTYLDCMGKPRSQEVRHTLCGQINILRYSQLATMLSTYFHMHTMLTGPKAAPCNPTFGNLSAIVARSGALDRFCAVRLHIIFDMIGQQLRWRSLSPDGMTNTFLLIYHANRRTNSTTT